MTKSESGIESESGIASESRAPTKDTSSRTSNEKDHANAHRTENSIGRDHRQKLHGPVQKDSHGSHHDELPSG